MHFFYNIKVTTQTIWDTQNKDKDKDKANTSTSTSTRQMKHFNLQISAQHESMDDIAREQVFRSISDNMI